MRTIFKLSVALSLVVGALGFSVPAAFAAAPGNDVFSGATVVPSLPFSDSISTAEATTDADDAQLNTNCGAPATDASVWYTFQGTGSTVVVDVSESDYSAGVLVGTGTDGNLDIVACGPQAVAFFAEAGTTYYILAIDDQQNGDGLNGGTLNLSMYEIVSPTIDTFTVNRYGTVNTRTGVATISGTYSCSNADFMDVFVDARQPVGRFMILGTGEFFDFNTCDGTTHTWSAQVFPENGKFAGGKTMTVNFATSCGALECAFGYAEQKVQLRGGK
jgi:hypothetical protein